LALRAKYVALDSGLKLIMKRIILTTIIIFIVAIGLLFIVDNFIAQNNHQNIANLTQTNTGKQEFNSQKTNSFTLYEISKHNSEHSCYLVINNNVYDVSSYINRHPGGAKTIISHCGKEATGIFAKTHSNKAWDLLKKYKIGTISKNK